MFNGWLIGNIVWLVDVLKVENMIEWFLSGYVVEIVEDVVCCCEVGVFDEGCEKEFVYDGWEWGEEEECDDGVGYGVGVLKMVFF